MKKTLIALFTMLFVCAGAFAQSDLQVLAVVKYNKNESITVKQVKNKVKNLEMQIGQKLDVEGRKKVLDSLINEKLVLQAAAKSGISIPDSVVDQQFLGFIGSRLGGINFQTEAQLDEFLRQSVGVSLDDFILKSAGMSKKDFKENLRNTLIGQQYIIMANQEEFQKITASNEDIRLFYEAHKAELVRKDIAKVAVIYVPKDGNAGAAKIKMNDLREKLASKKLTFEQMKMQSKKEGSGYEIREELLPVNEQGAMSLNLTTKSMIEFFKNPEGFISEVVEAEDSYQCLCLLKKYEAKMLDLNDLMMPETNVTVYDYLRINLTQQLQSQFLQDTLLETANKLNTPENVEMKKTGAALDKLLNWGD